MYRIQRIILFTIILTGFLPIVLTGQESLSKPSTSEWIRNFTSAQEILSAYKGNRTDKWNNCFFVQKSGEYILRKKGKPADIRQLLQNIPALDLTAPETEAYMKKYGITRLVDSWYMLKAMQEGVPFDAARDGIAITTSLPERPLNSYDYAKLQNIFTGSTAIIQEAYLNKMKFMFRQHGCTAEMIPLQVLIEKNCRPSKLKNEILVLYRQYSPFTQGKVAPLSIFRDTKGRTVSLSDYRGKIIVIDVWATWCCSCIEKMPAFLQLQQDFRDENKLIFAAVSIDRQKDTHKWKQAIEKENMSSLLNLIASNEESTFSADYAVAGVPRYILIDSEGCIIDAYAPGPSDKLKEIIQKTLNTTTEK